MLLLIVLTQKLLYHNLLTMPVLGKITKPNDPRPIASSFSRKFPHWNRGKPWQTRGLFALDFPFRGQFKRLTQCILIHWVDDLRVVGDLLRRKFNLQVAACCHQLYMSNRSGTWHVRDVMFRWLRDDAIHDLSHRNCRFCHFVRL